MVIVRGIVFCFPRLTCIPTVLACSADDDIVSEDSSPQFVGGVMKLTEIRVGAVYINSNGGVADRYSYGGICQLGRH